jgi:holliday junction DNA helicase RuvA
MVGGGYGGEYRRTAELSGGIPFAPFPDSRYHYHMIAKLTGTVIDVRANHVVLDVHGVGYLIAITPTTLVSVGETVSLHTHLAVRENALDLYGFSTLDAYTMFEHLIKLPKIGPKTALQILGQADVQTLKKAVQTNDAVYLSKVSGIGKKSAEKIVAGLADMLDGTEFEGGDTETHNADTDVIETLITLGYSQKDALDAVQRIPKDITETSARIKQALKYVGR